MRQFEKNEWSHLHDVVLSAMWDFSFKIFNRNVDWNEERNTYT